MPSSHTKPANKKPPSIDEATIEHIAHLAQIELSPQEKTLMVKQLTPILDWIGLLDEVDIAQIEPLTHPIQLELPQREDIPAPAIDRKIALHNAAKSEAGFFVTPKTNE